MNNRISWLIAAAMLVASHGTSAQMTSNTGGSTGDWEFRIGPVFTQSKDISFDGGTTADLKSDTGFKLGTGYYITDQFVVGGNFAWCRSDFNGTVQGNNGAVAYENGRVDLSSLMFDATYLLGQGAFKPYGVVGLGWNWASTNIASGPPQTGCWWDPWWGYICSGYQPTKGSNSFTYQVGAGAQFNFNRSFAVTADYRYTVIDLDHATSNPGIGSIQLTFVWRAGHY
jgi:opacity protein-like surface antigen